MPFFRTDRLKAGGPDLFYEVISVMIHPDSDHDRFKLSAVDFFTNFFSILEKSIDGHISTSLEMILFLAKSEPQETILTDAKARTLDAIIAGIMLDILFWMRATKRKVVKNTAKK